MSKIKSMDRVGKWCVGMLLVLFIWNLFDFGWFRLVGMLLCGVSALACAWESVRLEKKADPK